VSVKVAVIIMLEVVFAANISVLDNCFVRNLSENFMSFLPQKA
jgi:hypothetical protein